jgi:F0F1-type ATP synthase membrane subunit b/b'
MSNFDTLLLILITILSTYPGVLIIVFLLKERQKNKVELAKIISEEKLQKIYTESLERLEDKIFDSIRKNFDLFLSEFGDELLSEMDLKGRIENMRKEIGKATNEYTNYLKAEAQKNSALLDQKTSEYLRQTQTHLAERVGKLLKEVESQTQEDLNQTRQKIKDYRRRKIEAVDKNAAKLLEEALQIVLKEKLSPAEHEKIIYEALEKAKQDGFFG